MIFMQETEYCLEIGMHVVVRELYSKYFMADPGCFDVKFRVLATSYIRNYPRDFKMLVSQAYSAGQTRSLRDFG